MDTEWMKEGNCRDIDPDVMFPHGSVGVETAKQICVGCPMRTECLEYALRNRLEHGVWGGASERERRRIARQRRLTKAS